MRFLLIGIFLVEVFGGDPFVSPTARWSTNATTVAGSANGAPGSSTSTLNSNQGIRIAENNTLYVADVSNNRIVLLRLNSSTAVSVLGNGLGSDPSRMYWPTDVEVTDDGIFVLDSLNYRVVRWEKNGTNPRLVAGVTGVATGPPSNRTFGAGQSLAVDHLAFVYVSDSSNNRVLRFPPNTSNGTSAVFTYGTGLAGFGYMGFQSPQGIHVDDNQNLFIADMTNHRIQKWPFDACAAITVAGSRTSGSSLGQLNNPKSVVTDTNGYMYIADAGNNRILRWPPQACSGECIAGCSGTAGTRSDQLNNPFIVAFDSQGSLLVSDESNHRVQRFSILNTTGKRDATHPWWPCEQDFSD